MNFKPPKGGVVDYSLKDFGPGRTKQADSAGCDINKIVARYERTGFLEHVRKTPGIFRDVSGYGDYHEMVTKVALAKQAFENLPADLRKRFRNDPAELIGFVSDDDNREEAVELGLIPAPKPKPKAEAVVDPEKTVLKATDASLKDLKEAKPPK